MESNPWKRITEKTAYENDWIRVQHNEVISPSGNKGVYGVVQFKNHAMGILPIDKDNCTYLVGQYRFALDEYSWEIPQGGCPIGKNMLDEAQRELKEETGITASEWKHLSDYSLSNSVTDETGRSFLARNLSFNKMEPEETEELQLKKVTLEQANEMVLKGEITDAISIISILKAKVHGVF